MYSIYMNLTKHKQKKLGSQMIKDYYLQEMYDNI